MHRFFDCSLSLKTMAQAFALVLGLTTVGHIAVGHIAAAEPVPKKIAAVVSVYHHNSHADMIVSRLLQTQTLDGKGERLPLQLVSLYTDQVPENDTSRRLSKEHGFPIYETVADTLTLGTGKLAVDGVLLVVEHGRYPVSETGQTQYPKRRLFEQIVQVFRDSGKVVPVFIDKHLSDNGKDARWIYDTAKELGIPLMAGSSLPTAARFPAVDIRRDQKLKEIVVTSYHTLDAYGFHALELAQCLAEQRQGGETGIVAVQCLVGDAVWQAGEQQVYDGELLTAALGRMRERPLPAGKRVRDLVKQPVLWVIDHTDGLRVNILTLNGAVAEWCAAWRYADGTVASMAAETTEWRPMIHFAYLVAGINQMFQTGKPAWPVERTLLTSCTLDELLISKAGQGTRNKTPSLSFAYRTNWKWKQPPPAPPRRPTNGQ